MMHFNINEAAPDLIITAPHKFDPLLHYKLDYQDINLVSSDVNDFIFQSLAQSPGLTSALRISSNEDLNYFLEAGVSNLINLKRINDIKDLNKLFEAVNRNLPLSGSFIGFMETSIERRKRIFKKFNRIIAYPYYVADFIIKRVFPKWGPTRKINYLLTRGNNRVLSLPEVLGRLVSCGFEITSHKEINNLTYFAAKKIKDPLYDFNPSYGALFKMERTGKGGKKINVYKLRTMHPYAEFLQDYIYKLNRLDEGGKFKDDFRITNWGHTFRRLWLDELPMLINWIKRDLKLVGVRPLSSHYLSLYTKELIERRFKYKPGLIPPYYADMPKTLTEIMESELRYLDAYEKNPLKTDFKYFWKAFNNIFIKHARSR
jgi:lipopolysaccharide/colanic/teichoic acid biosynthesis glycosyltransferase